MVFDGVDMVFNCVTLELPDRQNQRNISRIPAGRYRAIHHVSPRFGPSLWIKDVPGRSEILIHLGNYFTNTRGCILPGRAFADMNRDGELDVTSSRDTMTDLLSITPNTFQIDIIDE